MIGALPEPADGRTARTPRLAELGFPGLDALDIPVLVALSLGDPALLLGSPGSSRSALVEALATELALRPVVVDVSADASRARLVRAVEGPEANSVEQPAFLLLHGLERVGPERYAWVGEVLRQRRTQPRDSEAALYAWATAGMPEPGAPRALGAEVVRRFAWAFPFPDLPALTQDELRSSLRAVHSGESPLAPLGRERNAGQAVGQTRWQAAVDAVRANLGGAQDRWGPAVEDYAAVLAEELADAEPPLDARRLASVCRNVVGALAVPGVDRLEPSGRSALVRQVVRLSLPAFLLGRERERGMLRRAHEVAWGSAFGNLPPNGLARLRALGQAPASRMVGEWIEAAPHLTVEQHDRLLRRLLDEIVTARGHARVPAAAGVLEAARRLLGEFGRFPPELVARLLSWVDRATGLAAPPEEGETIAALVALLVPRSGPMDERDALSLRMALELARVVPGGSGWGRAEVAAPLVAQLRAQLDGRAE